MDNPGRAGWCAQPACLLPEVASRGAFGLPFATLSAFNRSLSFVKRDSKCNFRHNAARGRKRSRDSTTLLGARDCWRLRGDCGAPATVLARHHLNRLRAPRKNGHAIHWEMYRGFSPETIVTYFVMSATMQHQIATFICANLCNGVDTLR